MIERTHLDFFTGLGGFALAAEVNGVRTVGMCEIDKRCRAFLGGAWPEVAVHDDIRTWHYRKSDGPIWLCTAGVPCQPASRAGKQGGAADDRWLWPEAVRVLAEVRSTWALFENPPGIADVGIDGILSSLGGIGYETGIVTIPACAVDAPHRRERWYIICRRCRNVADVPTAGCQELRGRRVGNGKAGRQEPNGSVAARSEGCGGVAFANSNGRASGKPTTAATGYGDSFESEAGLMLANSAQPENVGGEHGDVAATEGRGGGVHAAAGRVGQVGVADTTGGGQRIDGGASRCAGHIDVGCAGSSLGDASIRSGRAGFGEAGEGWIGRRRLGDAGQRDGAWSDYVWVPCADGRVRRSPGHAVELVDGLHRSVLAALGNSIVWQVAAEIIAAMAKAEMEDYDGCQGLE